MKRIFKPVAMAAMLGSLVALGGCVYPYPYARQGVVYSDGGQYYGGNAAVDDQDATDYYYPSYDYAYDASPWYGYGYWPGYVGIGLYGGGYWGGGHWGHGRPGPWRHGYYGGGYRGGFRGGYSGGHAGASMHGSGGRH